MVLAIAVAGGLGWWFGQGPGSQVSVPTVSGLEMDAAVAMLAEADLEANITECSSLDIAAGLAVSTEPATGTRLDRGSTVEVCQSTGPELIEDPFRNQPFGHSEAPTGS